MNNEQKEKITTLLHKSKYGAIATVGPETPESAVITVVAIQDISVIFGSFKDSRKNRNIKQNPNVSFVVWDAESRRTVQMEGTAAHIPAIEAVMTDDAFQRNPEHDYFKITPQWIRYTDLEATPKEIWEVALP